MPNPVPSPFLIDGSEKFKIEKYDTKPASSDLDNKDYKKKLTKLCSELDSLQRVLYASQKFSLLVVFQAMDAAGKDSTIRAVMKEVDPAGCNVHSFKQPTHLELRHDFLWRTSLCLPEKGMIGVFNRSYYEEVLITRIHPEYLAAQGIQQDQINDQFWQERFESIADHEKHLARNNTIIVKFFLNISKSEQKKRFLSRIDDLDKNWKFEKSDIEERKNWDNYLDAYEKAINASAKSWAPWYIIPADSKPYMRYLVADILVQTLTNLGLTYPRVGRREQKEIQEMRSLLEEK